MNRVVSLICAGALALSSLLIVGATPALGACAGTITYYDGPNGTGAHMTLCANEYPASGEACSFDQSFCKFTDGTSPNNRIESSNFINAPVGTRIVVCTGYYFGGTCAQVPKPTGSGQIVNWGGIYSNNVSSLYSCGTDGCGDER